MNVWIVTGTDTDVGKTMTTATLAAALTCLGRSVAIHKPAQTGMDGPDDPGDAHLAQHLSGAPHASEGVRLRAPLAPCRAATIEGAPLPRPAEHLQRIRSLAASFDEVIVEGAGGLLVELAPGWDIGDLACDLTGGTSPATSSDTGPARGSNPDMDPSDPGLRVRIVVTVRAGLGTLNHTDLTLRELSRRGVHVAAGHASGPASGAASGVASGAASDALESPELAGLVIGSWSEPPGLAESTNLTDLAALAPILGTLPSGMGAWEPDQLRSRCLDLLAPAASILKDAP